MSRPPIWDQLEVHYQPTVRLVDGQPLIVEALLRWRHPVLGLLPAARFLPALQRVAERGLLCRFVLNEALGALPRLRNALLTPSLQVAVNLWAQEILDGGAAEELERALEDSRVDPTSVIIELRPDVLTDETIRADLARLGELGVRLCLDDFGRATASFGLLERVALDHVKIDHSLIAQLDDRGRAHRIVAALVCVAGDLGIATVAEGVEWPAQVAVLQRVGVHAAQGRLFARPLPVPSIPAHPAGAGAR